MIFLSPYPDGNIHAILNYLCHRSSMPPPFLPAHIGDVKWASNHDAVRSVVIKCRRLENFSSVILYFQRTSVLTCLFLWNNVGYFEN